MGITELISLTVVGVAGFIGWLFRDKFKAIETLDKRVNTLETKFDVLGDIVSKLTQITIDLEVIKSKIDRN